MFIPVRQMVITNGTAASSAAVLMNEAGIPQDVWDLQVQITCTTPTVVRFGTSGVVADRTVTSSYMPDGNFYVPSDVPVPYCVLNSFTHVACQSADGATAGTTYITLGYNEKT